MNSMVVALFPFQSEYEWFWVMCQFVAVSCTLVFIFKQMRLQNDSHLVNSFDIFRERWDSRMMLHARREICANYKQDAERVDGTMHHLCLFFEELGVFSSKSVLDFDIVWEIYSFEIEHYWVMMKNAINSFRSDQRDESFYYHFERLYRRNRRLNARKKAPTHERTSVDIKNFVKHELQKVEFFLKADDHLSGSRVRRNQRNSQRPPEDDVS